MRPSDRRTELERRTTEPYPSRSGAVRQRSCQVKRIRPPPIRVGSSDRQGSTDRDGAAQIEISMPAGPRVPTRTELSVRVGTSGSGSNYRFE